MKKLIYTFTLATVVIFSIISCNKNQYASPVISLYSLSVDTLDYVPTVGDSLMFLPISVKSEAGLTKIVYYKNDSLVKTVTSFDNEGSYYDNFEVNANKSFTFHVQAFDREEQSYRDSIFVNVIK
jgi:hypothetical protein